MEAGGLSVDPAGLSEGAGGMYAGPEAPAALLSGLAAGWICAHADSARSATVAAAQSSLVFMDSSPN